VPVAMMRVVVIRVPMRITALGMPLTVRMVMVIVIFMFHSPSNP
jgi:hypothetical protein